MASASERLAALERGATAEAVLALFDELPPATIDGMIGSWRGSGLPTHHPLDGLLEAYAWHGKRFDGPDSVHPLLFRRAGGAVFSVNPSVVQLRPLLNHAALLRRPAIAAIGRRMLGLAATGTPQARLRLIAFRGVVTATMIYDALPINDVFRHVDADTRLGVMDMRYTPDPFFFVLRRDRLPDAPSV